MRRPTRRARGTSVETAAIPEPLVEPEVAAAITGLTVRGLETLRRRGGGPPFYAIARRAVRYLPTECVAWRDARRRRSTSDPGPGDAGR